MRGGLRDVERAAACLTVTQAATAPEVIATGTVSVFQSAGESGLIPDDTAQRLAEAARMWRNLRGILRLLAEDDSVDDATCPMARTVIATSCGTEDFDALNAAIKVTAARATTDIDTLLAR